jgi:hypothetical protein
MIDREMDGRFIASIPDLGDLYGVASRNPNRNIYNSCMIAKGYTAG